MSTKGSCTAAHSLFNLFLRELVLLSKQHGSQRHKTALKRQFKLFNIHSTDYAPAFVQLSDCELGPARLAANDAEVFPGVTAGDLRSCVPKGDHQLLEALISGMMVAASLVQDCADPLIVSSVTSAYMSGQAHECEQTILDEDLMACVKKVCAATLPDRLLDGIAPMQAASAGNALQVPGMGSEGGAGLGSGTSLFQLAKEVSQGIDMTALMGASGSAGSGNPDAMNDIVKSINDRVMAKMQDGSVDPERLCREAQSLLGNFGM